MVKMKDEMGADYTVSHFKVEPAGGLDGAPPLK